MTMDNTKITEGKKMTTARIEDNKVYLSQSYKFGPEQISVLNFGQVTAREMGELPADFTGLKLKDLYPIISMLIGMPQSFINLLLKQDISMVVQHTTFLLGD